MRKNLVVVVVAWIGLSCGCGSSPPKLKRYKHEPPEKAYSLAIWIEDDARMPADLVLAGCGPWKAEGVTCTRTSKKDEAAIRVYADDGECQRWDDKSKRHRTTLAWAFVGGDIKMMMKCLTLENGIVQSVQLSGVVTHEIGHQTGIWEHVPYACDKAKKHEASGNPICGVAVMNPYFNPNVVVLTDVDAMAFDERDMYYSVLVSNPPPKDPSVPDCVYYAP